MNKELFNKYLAGDCSSEEFEEFASWIESISFSKEGKEICFEDWKTLNPSEKESDKEKYNYLLDKIHHEINLKEHKVPKERTLFSSFIRSFYRAAAILFLPMLGIILYLLTNNSFQSSLTAESGIDTLEVIAPIGSRTIVQLTDGTIVNLNYGSRIKYPREFTGNKREIKLIGEAYFDVAHNANKPFIVETGKLNIKVLGTEFNVQAYPGDENVSTTLVKGKVSLEDVDQNGDKNANWYYGTGTTR